MASFSGIKNTLLAEQVEEQLYEYITKLPLKAGDKLPNEFKLAEMFGVGRSTVREAVKLMVSRNVLETRRGSGTYVKDLVPTDLDPLNLRNVDSGAGHRRAGSLQRHRRRDRTSERPVRHCGI